MPKSDKSPNKSLITIKITEGRNDEFRMTSSLVWPMRLFSSNIDVIITRLQCPASSDLIGRKRHPRGEDRTTDITASIK